MRTMILAAWLSAVPSLVLSPAAAPPPAAPAVAAAEDYRAPAGRRVGDTLVATFELRTATWRPQGPRAVAVPVYVFAEPGRSPRVPGPMLRAPEGGWIRLTLRNRLPKRAVLRGLQPRPFAADAVDSIALAPGADTTIAFRAGVAGSYFYWGRTTPTRRHRVAPLPDDFYGGEAEEGPFVGALVVDPPGARPDPRERTFVITRWLDEFLPALNDTIDWKLAINGASWPATERLAATVGDSVRWRVINATATSHPMHLHGFYFRVLAHDAMHQPGPVPDSARHEVVTELLDAGESMRMAWVPERPGNWLFHCHLVRHMSASQAFPPARAAVAAAGPPDAHAAHGDHEMAGLVLGITVRARPGVGAAAAEAAAAGRGPVPARERPIALWAQARPGGFGATPRYAFIAQERGAAPARDSVTVPSSTLVLRRGEPVRITVHNTLAVPLSVHWHGLELESWFDGVGGESGMGRRTRPPIAPGDSFVVRFTPPRAGTFMYHTHDEAGSELAAGLHGALLVVDDPAMRDAAHDHVLLLSTYGPTDSGTVAVNGRRDPPPLTLEAGATHRLRLAAVPSNERVSVALVRPAPDSASRGEVGRWRLLAVDGAELAPRQQVSLPARRLLGAGMTADVAFRMPEEAGWVLEVRMQPYEAFELPGSRVRIPLVPRR